MLCMVAVGCVMHPFRRRRSRRAPRRPHDGHRLVCGRLATCRLRPDRDAGPAPTPVRRPRHRPRHGLHLPTERTLRSDLRRRRLHPHPTGSGDGLRLLAAHVPGQWCLWAGNPRAVDGPATGQPRHAPAVGRVLRVAATIDDPIGGRCRGPGRWPLSKGQAAAHRLSDMKAIAVAVLCALLAGCAAPLPSGRPSSSPMPLTPGEHRLAHRAADPVGARGGHTVRGRRPRRRPPRRRIGSACGLARRHLAWDPHGRRLAARLSGEVRPDLEVLDASEVVVLRAGDVVTGACGTADPGILLLEPPFS